MTTTIDPRNGVLTLINVFAVEPQDQQKLVDLLVTATDRTMQHLPGFVSANIHRSLDGKKVVNYAQWKDQAAFDAMQRHPEAAPHMKAAAALAKFEPILCEVVDATSAR